MPSIMTWDKLISQDRFYKDDKVPPPPTDDDIVRSHHKDVDRVLFSSAFRRLQGKTQVHMFPRSDYVRNRLTHTLEVVSISRILSSIVINKLRRYNTPFRNACENKRFRNEDLIEAIAAACYAHDIGNAPFGHIGEYAIRSWFSDNLPKKSEKPALVAAAHIPSSLEVDIKQEDAWLARASSRGFKYFDGNAQGFRTIIELQGWRKFGGLQLTKMTIASFMKYPYSARYANAKKAKFGFFADQEDDFRAIADAVGLIRNKRAHYSRHPFALIVEAADDIAYLTTDIEDAVKLGILPYDLIESILIDIARLQNISTNGQLITRFYDTRFSQTKEKTQDRLKFLRSAAMVGLVNVAAIEFDRNLSKIMDGTFEGGLLESHPDCKNYIERIRDICKSNIYYSQEKIRREAGAYEVIRSLLDKLSEAIEDYFRFEREKRSLADSAIDVNDRNKNILRILGKGKPIEQPFDFQNPRYESIYNPLIQKYGPEYFAYTEILNFVSGMTDSYALQINSEITGVGLPVRR